MPYPMIKAWGLALFCLLPLNVHAAGDRIALLIQVLDVDVEDGAPLSDRDFLPARFRAATQSFIINRVETIQVCYLAELNARLKALSLDPEDRIERLMIVGQGTNTLLTEREPRFAGGHARDLTIGSIRIRAPGDFEWNIGMGNSERFRQVNADLLGAFAPLHDKFGRDAMVLLMVPTLFAKGRWPQMGTARAVAEVLGLEEGSIYGLSSKFMPHIEAYGVTGPYRHTTTRRKVIASAKGLAVTAAMVASAGLMMEDHLVASAAVASGATAGVFTQLFRHRGLLVKYGVHKKQWIWRRAPAVINEFFGRGCEDLFTISQASTQLE